jgi:hypothetical protein
VRHGHGRARNVVRHAGLANPKGDVILAGCEDVDDVAMVGEAGPGICDGAGADGHDIEARADEGDPLSVLLLPAATVTWTLCPVREVTALSRGVLAEPPRDI